MERRRHTVLCIGSDPINLNLRCSLLKEHGWHVLGAGSGHEGVIRFAQESVDAVVLDLNHDGSESALIAAELKRQRPAVLVIMLVAARETLAQGATEQANAVLLRCDEARDLHVTLRNLTAVG